MSAVESGIRTIPLVLSLVLGAISAGQLTGRIGYYTPFMILSGIIMPIGAGLITTFTVDTPEPIWIGYQVLVGYGIGTGMQQGALAAQTVLGKKDVPIGVSLMFFCQMLGGAIFVSVGQNVFNQELVSALVKLVPGLSPLEIVNTGATDLKDHVPKEVLQQVLVASNSALRQTFVVATAMGALSILGTVLVKWRSVKGKAGPEGGKKSTEEKKDHAADAKA